NIRLRGGRLLDDEALRCERCPARVALRIEPLHETLGVLARDERALQARRLGLTWRDEEHVTVPEQRLGADAVENRSAVDLRRHAESDATREVRLYQPREDVPARALRREDEVNADRSRFLGEHLQR